MNIIKQCNKQKDPVKAYGSEKLLFFTKSLANVLLYSPFFLAVLPEKKICRYGK